MRWSRIISEYVILGLIVTAISLYSRPGRRQTSSPHMKEYLQAAVLDTEQIEAMKEHQKQHEEAKEQEILELKARLEKLENKTSAPM